MTICQSFSRKKGLSPVGFEALQPLPKRMDDLKEYIKRNFQDT